LVAFGETSGLAWDFLPLTNEIVDVLRKGMPSHEQLDAWKARYDEMNQRLYELTARFEEFRLAVDPSFRYDA
jgi:hypothetical protein